MGVSDMYSNDGASKIGEKILVITSLLDMICQKFFYYVHVLN